ncbi:hypothetical protein LCGC14_2196760 [marine sediment metagenome]|uniref:Uncharacterized protein n=1 Tax=marine sediment metagenome TaxID=412755 RepID=A0A0F9E541_9ZZZZ
MLKGEKIIDRNVNFVHTARVSHVTWDGVPVTRVSLRRYSKSTRRLMDEMDIPVEALQELLLDEELRKAWHHA